MYDKKTADAIARGEVAPAALEADNQLMLEEIVRQIKCADENPELLAAFWGDSPSTKTEAEIHEEYLDFLGLTDATQA